MWSASGGDGDEGKTGRVEEESGEGQVYMRLWGTGQNGWEKRI